MEISDDVLRMSLRRDCINVGRDVPATALLLLLLLVSLAEAVGIVANRRVGRLNLGGSDGGAAVDAEVEGALEGSSSVSAEFWANSSISHACISSAESLGVEDSVTVELVE